MQEQAYIFTVFILNGIIIGLLFDIFRTLRKSFKTTDFITYFEDFIFWILTFLLILYSIFKFNQGEIRLFIFIAIILGITIYLLLFSRLFIMVNTKIFLVIKKCFYIIIISPIKYVALFVKKMLFKPITFILIDTKKILSKSLKKMKNFKVKKKKIKKRKDFKHDC